MPGIQFSKLTLKVKWIRKKRNFRIYLTRKTRFWTSRDNSWKLKDSKLVRKRPKFKWIICNLKRRWSNYRKRKTSWKESREEFMIQLLRTNCMWTTKLLGDSDKKLRIMIAIS